MGLTEPKREMWCDRNVVRAAFEVLTTYFSSEITYELSVLLRGILSKAFASLKQKHPAEHVARIRQLFETLFLKYWAIKVYDRKDDSCIVGTST